jgi:hypothetical protein
MEYFLAEIQILRIKSFHQLIKAESFDKAQEIAEREFSMEDGYRVTIYSYVPDWMIGMNNFYC